MTVSLPPAAARSAPTPRVCLPIDENGEPLPGYRCYPVATLRGKVKKDPPPFILDLNETFHAYAFINEIPRSAYGFHIGRRVAGQESILGQGVAQANDRSAAARLDASVGGLPGANIGIGGRLVRNSVDQRYSEVQTNREILDFWISGGEKDGMMIGEETSADLIIYTRNLTVLKGIGVQTSSQLIETLFPERESLIRKVSEKEAQIGTLTQENNVQTQEMAIQALRIELLLAKLQEKEGAIQSLKETLASVQQATQNITSPEVSPAASVRLPSGAFGAKRWLDYFGLQVDEVPLPSALTAFLDRDCRIKAGYKVRDTHSLFLLPKALNGESMCLETFIKYVQSRKKGHPAKYRDSSNYPPNRTLEGESYWVLMAKEIFPATYDKVYSDQQKIVREKFPEYRAPTTLEAVACLVLERVCSGRYLYVLSDRASYTACDEGDSLPAVVGGFEALELRVRVNNSFSDPSSNVGIAGVVRTL